MSRCRKILVVGFTLPQIMGTGASAGKLRDDIAIDPKAVSSPACS